MRQSGSTWLFYGLVGGLNLAVIGMFYVVNIPPPAPATSVNRPIVRASVAPSVVPVKQGTPTRLSVPSLGINLAVQVGVYDAPTMSWTVDNVHAYYANMSVPINDHNGTTLIYGHAQAPVFARLPEIQPGANATVVTDNGYRFQYRYVAMTQVTPTDVGVLRVDGPPTLVLQTCMGVWDAYRGLFSFELQSVEKV